MPKQLLKKLPEALPMYLDKEIPSALYFTHQWGGKNPLLIRSNPTSLINVPIRSIHTQRDAHKTLQTIWLGSFPQMLLTRAVQGGRSSAGDELSQREAPGKRHGGSSFHEAWRWDRSVFSTHGYLLAGFRGYSYHMQPCFTSADRSRIAAALIGTQMCWFIFAYLSDILQTQVGSGNLTEPPKNSSECKKK